MREKVQPFAEGVANLRRRCFDRSCYRHHCHNIRFQLIGLVSAAVRHAVRSGASRALHTPLGLQTPGEATKAFTKAKIFCGGQGIVVCVWTGNRTLAAKACLLQGTYFHHLA